MRGCQDEASCRLDTDKLIVRVILIGYNKAECLDGDMPISMDTSPLMSEGKVKVLALCCLLMMDLCWMPVTVDTVSSMSWGEVRVLFVWQGRVCRMIDS